MRAHEPDDTGFAERGGVRICYEVHGDGPSTILLLPTWSIMHSRCWKMQVPYLARHCRVITFDGRGNGRSDRPEDAPAYVETEFAADALAVMDAAEIASAVIVGFSLGAMRALILAAEHPDRVEGLIFIGASLPLTPPHPERTVYPFDEPVAETEGWAKCNRHYWQKDYRGFLEFFFSQVYSEPHSTKPIEDCTDWGLETTPEVLAATALAEAPDEAETLSLCSRIRCPVLVLHGGEDRISPAARGRVLAEATGGRLVVLEGSGHAPHARDPVKVNLLIREFADGLPGAAPTSSPQRWSRGRRRRRRALYISSPIGLGHAQRDVAIAKELRRLHPDLEIDWLAQHPVTKVLEAEDERIHPASALLASESRHIETESAGHDLHCFQAWRRMDEIMAANFMVFHDLIRDNPYDLWIGDEAWELDYYLHENPEQKRAAYAWLTDFVGWLPMPDGGEREAYLTADYNAEMIGHIARYPRVRDRALFVGSPDVIVPDRFGPDLPTIRAWTEQHYDFPGYVSGFDPAALADRAALRAELGYAEDEKVCIVTVGGSGVGAALLKRIMDAYPAAQKRVPALRMIVVAGPRIDPASLPRHEGLEVRAYVHKLYRHLAACDLALVQGGLTTAMELTANRRPFIYFPLGHHFEQNFHVHHRLRCHGAGRRMDFENATPDAIAEAIGEEIGRDVEYRPVERDGARRAAELIGEML